MSILYKSLVLGSSPLVYYRLGEPSGTTANDSSGNGSNGTLGGSGTTLNVAGGITGDANTAYTFNGSGQVTSTIASGIPTGAAVWTLEAWIKMTTVTGAALQTIASFGTWNVNNESAFICIDTTGHPQIGTFGGNHSAAGAITANAWHHIVGAYDGANMLLYVDGSLVGTYAQTMILTGTSFAIASTIGGLHNSFSGTIDEVALYPSLLSASTILGHYNTGVLSDSNPYTVSNGNIIFATDVNQIINIFQRNAGSSETGKYCLSGNSYAATGVVTLYVNSLSRNSTPVSASVDTSDTTPPAWFNAITANHPTNGGLEITTTYNAANGGGAGAGNYTLNY